MIFQDNIVKKYLQIHSRKKYYYMKNKIIAKCVEFICNLCEKNKFVEVKDERFYIYYRSEWSGQNYIE